LVYFFLKERGMKVVYVIGPYRGKTHWEVVENVRRAEQLGLKVAMLGAMPLIPHKNTENFDGLLDDDFWLEGTKELLRRADAAITVEALDLPWRYSVGSAGEVKEMVDVLKRPVFHSLDSLRLWLTDQRAASTS
jgi:hypothetical protein